MKELFMYAYLYAAVFVTIAVTFFAGWIANLIAVIQALGDPVTGMFVLRAVGILAAPLGSILGILGWF